MKYIVHSYTCICHGDIYIHIYTYLSIYIYIYIQFFTQHLVWSAKQGKKIKQ